MIASLGSGVLDIVDAAESKRQCTKYKTIIGRRLHARSLYNQKVEADIGCNVISRMTALGMPVSVRVK
jgi:hypothetical protein